MPQIGYVLPITLSIAVVCLELMRFVARSWMPSHDAPGGAASEGPIKPETEEGK